VLVIVLQCQRVFGGREIVQIRDGLIGNEVCRLVRNTFSGKFSVGVKFGFADGNKYWPFGTCSSTVRVTRG